MVDLRTNYMGLELKNPIVPSASPLSEDFSKIVAMQEAGASAVVLYSLFEEQINLQSQELDHYLSYGVESFPEALDYYPDLETYHVGADNYISLISEIKPVVDIPIIASLNGVSVGGWIEYAQKIEQAGADALELNIYYIPTNPDLPGAEVEQMYVDVVKAVTDSINIPVAVKVGPYFSSTANMMKQLVAAGAAGLVLFNRFYQPDFDIDELEVVPRVVLSTANEMRLPLRWVSILYGRVAADFAITSGVHTHVEVLKGMMAGAKVSMMASALLQHGIGRMTQVLEQLVQWMEENEYESIEQMQGSMSQQNIAEPAIFERANYMKVLQSWRPDPAGQLFQVK